MHEGKHTEPRLRTPAGLHSSLHECLVKMEETLAAVVGATVSLLVSSLTLFPQRFLSTFGVIPRQGSHTCWCSVTPSVSLLVFTHLSLYLLAVNSLSVSCSALSSSWLFTLVMLAAHMCFVNCEALGATEQQGIVSTVSGSHCFSRESDEWKTWRQCGAPSLPERREVIN